MFTFDFSFSSDYVRGCVGVFVLRE